MKTIYRNLLSVIRRFKMATLLNVAGLSVAFAAFMVIMMQVDYERSFDRCHPGAERVFRVDLSGPDLFSTILPRGFIEEVLKSSPHIEAGTLLNPFIGEVYFTVTTNGEKHGFREVVQTCHPEIVQTFGFPIIEGSPTCLHQPDKVIIPESMARRLFGHESAVGKALHAEAGIWSKSREGTKESPDLTVGAVYRDFPGNTQLRNAIYTAIDNDCMKTDFGASNFICYLRLDDAASANDVEQTFNSHFDFANIDRPNESIKLVPLTDIYYLNEGGDGRIFRSGNADVTRILFAIALLILIVAAVNYTNFSTAMTPVRMKSINTQKVLGSSTAMLRLSLLAEAVIICLLSWAVAILIVAGLTDGMMLSFIDADIAPLHNIPLIGLTGAVALLTGIAAGLYPSFYMTSFPPAMVLKGSFGLSPKGRQLRTALVGFQFVISMGLIIAAGFIQLQNHFLRTYSTGFDKEQIAVVELGQSILQRSDEYTNRLKGFAGIEEVAFSSEKIGAQDEYATQGAIYKGEEFSYLMIKVSWNFLRVMGISVEEGRDFSESDLRGERPVFIFNDYAKQHLNMELGLFKYWADYTGEIVGFAENVQITSLRHENQILCLAMTNGRPLPVSYIRLKAGTDIRAAVEHIRKTIAGLDPSYPVDIEFYDSIFDQLYRKETNLRSMITLFGLLAVILSLVGVFGLVVFDSEYRKKEIGIRKVFGSTTQQILVMFNKTYLKIVVVCFVFAAPAAYYAVVKWLENFAYKTPLYWWVFALSFAVVAFVTFATVTFQNWRAANANPVKSLRSE